MGLWLLSCFLLGNLSSAFSSLKFRQKSAPVWTGETVQDLWKEYYNIFPTSNRNGAAYKWSTFLLERSWQMSPEKFEMLNTGFCAVAASIVRPRDYSRYRLTLPKVTGGQKEGIMYYCCWPCICDTMDFIRVDTKTITLANGVSRQYDFAVIGNPCANQDKLYAPYQDPFTGATESITQSAPEIKCTGNGELIGGTLSDNGYIIMSMFHGNAENYHHNNAPGSKANAGYQIVEACQKRADNGYNSGMGKIFRKIAGVSPITAAPKSPQPTYAFAASDLKVQEFNISSTPEQAAPSECPCSRKNKEPSNPVARALASLKLSLDQAVCSALSKPSA